MYRYCKIQQKNLHYVSRPILYQFPINYDSKIQSFLVLDSYFSRIQILMVTLSIRFVGLFRVFPTYTTQAYQSVQTSPQIITKSSLLPKIKQVTLYLPPGNCASNKLIWNDTAFSGSRWLLRCLRSVVWTQWVTRRLALLMELQNQIQKFYSAHCLLGGYYCDKLKR